MRQNVSKTGWQKSHSVSRIPQFHQYPTVLSTICDARRAETDTKRAKTLQVEEILLLHKTENQSSTIHIKCNRIRYAPSVKNVEPFALNTKHRGQSVNVCLEETVMSAVLKELTSCQIIIINALGSTISRRLSFLLALTFIVVAPRL